MAAPAPAPTRGAPTRRFIYLIMDGENDTHTLHRIDTGPLFAAGRRRAQHRPEEATATATPPAAAAAAAATLPRPSARFECGRGRQFLPLGRGVEKIVSVDMNRHTVIFDTRTESVRAGADARHVKWQAHPGSTWAEAGGKLYHLGRDPGYDEPAVCLDFEALTYDPCRNDWCWNLLPSPPFGRYTDAIIQSFADAGGDGSTIRISTTNDTYAFDAARASWRKEGDWAMPFRGHAQYVADYGLWFGFADDRGSALCAADLNAAGRPVWWHMWDNVVDDGHANHAGAWLIRSYLSYLGSGRFCVTRFFPDKDKDGRSVMTAIVTAVEATRAA